MIFAGLVRSLPRQNRLVFFVKMAESLASFAGLVVSLSILATAAVLIFGKWKLISICGWGLVLTAQGSFEAAIYDANNDGLWSRDGLRIDALKSCLGETGKPVLSLDEMFHRADVDDRNIYPLKNSINIEHFGQEATKHFPSLQIFHVTNLTTTK